MNFPRSSLYVLRACLFVLAFCGLIAYGLYWSRGDLVPFFNTRPWINGTIVGLAALGLLISFRELIRLLVQSSRMDELVNRLRADEESEGESADLADSIGSGLVRDRVGRILRLSREGSGSFSVAAAVLSDADAEAEESRGALVRYLIGVMVFLGLIGTFWGLLTTVAGVKDVLSALEPSRVEDPTQFLAQLKSSIGGMLGGMSTAFSTSLFGLGGSVILGFVDVQTRQARSRLLADLDRFVVTHLLPAHKPVTDEPGETRRPRRETPDQLYQYAIQEALGENFRHLAEVMTRQAASDERLGASLVEMKGALESLREEESQTRNAVQAANQTRQIVVDRLDGLGRQMERLVTEIRLNTESSEEIGRALLDRLKLEGEITNKTLSRGFSDIGRKLEEELGNYRDTGGSDREEY